MKKIVSLVLALVLALSLVACGSGNTPNNSANPGVSDTPAPSVPVEDPAFGADLTAFYEKMMNAAVSAPSMMPLEGEYLDAFYPGLTAIETKQCVVAMPMMMGALAIEFAFVEVADAKDVAAMQAVLQGRIDSVINAETNYPSTLDIWQNHAEVVTIGNYVCLFATPDKDALIEAFRNGTDVPAWSQAEIIDDGNGDVEDIVDLAAFYDELYQKLFPVDENGEFTGPAAENIAEMPELLDTFYPGLSAIDTWQKYVLMPMISAVPYEVVLIEVMNSEDVEAVKAILQARIDSQTDPAAMNYPMITENWEMNSRIVVNGNYIMLVATEYVDAFVEAFNAQF